MSQKDLRDIIINNPRARDRIIMKEIEHEVRGCHDPLCMYCKDKRNNVANYG